MAFHQSMYAFKVALIQRTPKFVKKCQQYFLWVDSSTTISLKLKESFLRHSKTSMAVSNVSVQLSVSKSIVFQCGSKVIAGEGTKGTFFLLLPMAVLQARYFTMDGYPK